MEIWSDLAFGGRQVEQFDWKQLLHGYIATTDMPCALYFKEIAETFPDAKVVLTVRGESEWFESYCRLLAAIHRFRFLRSLPPLDRFWPYGTKLHEIIFGEHAFDKSGPVRELVIDAYRRHNELVYKTIAPARLLEFDVRQGWQPLCEFLDFDVPQADFPHLNAGISGPSKIIAQAVRQLSLRRVLMAVGIVFVFSMILFLVLKFGAIPTTAAIVNVDVSSVTGEFVICFAGVQQTQTTLRNFNLEDLSVPGIL